MKKEILLNNFYGAVNDLAWFFVDKYFGHNSDWYWIADEVGVVLEVNDRFFNLNQIVDYLKYKYTSKDMFAHYDESLDNTVRGKDLISIKNWKKLRKLK